MRLNDRDLTGLAGTFLGDLSPAARATVLRQASLIDIPRGRPIFADSPGQQRLGLVLEGTVRAFISLPDGTQLTVRHARHRSLVTTLTSPSATPVHISLQAMTPCAVVELPVETLTNLMKTDHTVAVATLAELARRTEDVYRAFAAHAAGVVRERLAAYLLDATHATDDGHLITEITQPQLAQALGTAREVVSRIMRELKTEGIVRQGRGEIAVLQPGRLIDIAGPWWAAGRVVTTDPDHPLAGAFDVFPNAVIGIDAAGVIAYANASVSSTFGWEPQQLVGKASMTLMPRGIAASFQGSLGSFMSDVRTRPIGLGQSFHGRRADGTEFPAEITILPTREPTGMIVFATVIDLTYQAALRAYLTARSRS